MHLQGSPTSKVEQSNIPYTSWSPHKTGKWSGCVLYTLNSGFNSILVDLVAFHGPTKIVIHIFNLLFSRTLRHLAGGLSLRGRLH